MLKRFYSKRSGFTLAEIIVAFAVFALMSAMVAQILDLAVKARQKNNDYARDLADQQHNLTVIEKSSTEFETQTGEMVMDFGGGVGEVKLPYQTKSANVMTANDLEGINYFLGNVNYLTDPEESTPGDASDFGDGSGSQASRMDTRLTGTSGIGFIRVVYVQKDTHTYDDPSSPFYLEPGNTRYLIGVYASPVDVDGKDKLLDENVPYSQYRMYFYTDEKYESPEYEDADGKTYTMDLYKKAVIKNIGYISNWTNASTNGLTNSNTASTYGSDIHSSNPYSIELVNSNTVRIGSPFVTGRNGGVTLNGQLKGMKFSGGVFSYFYVDFEGDPNITTESFGSNGCVPEGSSVSGTTYAPYPVYEENFDASGKCTYEETGKKYVNIYGAYINDRHYK